MRLNEFWSNAEFKAVKGNPPHQMAEYRAKQKLSKAVRGLKEIENPRIVTASAIIDLLEACENILRISGFVSESETIAKVKDSVRSSIVKAKE